VVEHSSEVGKQVARHGPRAARRNGINHLLDVNVRDFGGPLVCERWKGVAPQSSLDFGSPGHSSLPLIRQVLFCKVAERESVTVVVDLGGLSLGNGVFSAVDGLHDFAGLCTCIGEAERRIAAKPELALDLAAIFRQRILRAPGALALSLPVGSDHRENEPWVSLDAVLHLSA
jgi:hypothetical protein